MPLDREEVRASNVVVLVVLFEARMRPRRFGEEVSVVSPGNMDPVVGDGLISREGDDVRTRRISDELLLVRGTWDGTKWSFLEGESPPGAPLWL